MQSKQQSILIGALVTGVLSTSVLGLINALCCAGVILGGMASVWHYTSTYDAAVDTGDGALMGALAGAGGAILAAILNYILLTLGLNFSQEIVMGMLQSLDVDTSQIPMEQSQDLGTIAFNAVSSAILYAIFGAVGGAIGASVFGDDADPTVQGA
jgi:hypothetical protein